MIKTLRIVLPLAIVLLFVVSLSNAGGDTESAGSGTSISQSKVKSVASSQQPAPQVSKGVRDGELAFVVTSVQRPGRTLTSQLGKETAQGEFVIVRVDVTNVGGVAKPFTVTCQFLVNDKGQRFAPSSAIMSLKGADEVFAKRISPGTTVTGAQLLFDVAQGTKIVSVELHDSLSSAGVQVKLP